jgi:N-acetylglutamate synthase
MSGAYGVLRACESGAPMSTLPAAETVAIAMAGTWALLAETVTTGWARDHGQAIALVTGLPIPTLNGVWAVRSGTAAEDIDAGLDAVAASGHPHCLEARDAMREEAAAVAARHGLVAQPDIPLMAIGGPAAAPARDGLAMRPLEPAEANVHCEVAGPAFGAPPELFAQLMTPAVLELPAVTTYVGEVDGRPVVTAVGVAVGEAVGIFNVATPPEHRRRGYGSAITARVLADGLAAGASFGWLQSSEDGYRLYEAMGFETIERFPLWISRA